MGTYASAQRKWQRQTLKEIKTILHPCPTVNGAVILHQHKGKHIIFNAWIGNDPVNGKYMRVHRDHVLYNSNFYETHKSELEWLAE